MSQGSRGTRGFFGTRGAPPVPLRPRARATIPLSPSARLRELVGRKDAAHLVRTAPVQDLFLLTRQIGLSDSLELLELASPDQLQRMIDLDIWERDDIKLDTYGEWLEATVESRSVDKLRALIEGLDPEPLVLYLQEHVTPHLLEDDMLEERRLELEAKAGFHTPDRRYFVEVGLDDDRADFCRRLIEKVYATDEKLAYWLMESIRWELSSHLEEQAYRQRSERVEELGYFDAFEAQVIYAPLRGSTPSPREPISQPEAGPLREVPLALEHVRPADGSFISRVLEALRQTHPDDDPTRELLRLANKVMAADVLDPGDLEAVSAALRRVRAYVGLGLELEAGDDVDRGVALIRTVHAEWLFRRGFTQALQVQRQAKELERRGLPAFRDLPGPHADSPYREVLEGALMRRPMYYTGLTQAKAEEYVPFQKVAQIDETRRVLTALEHVHRFVFEFLAPGPVELGRLRASLERMHLELTPGGVMLTSLAQRVIGGAFAPEPLSPAQLGDFLQRVFEPMTSAGRRRVLTADFVQQVHASGEAFAATAGDEAEAAIRPFVAGLLEALWDAYGAIDLDRSIPIELVGGPLYLLREP